MAKIRARKVAAEKMTKKTMRKQRGKHCQWSEAAMVAAIEAVQVRGMSQREACKSFSIPRCTLQVRLSGKTELGAKPGRPTTLSKEEEEKLVDFACNRAALGVGFGRRQFLTYADNFATKHNKPFKAGTPSTRWWNGMRRRHQRMTLRKPECTAAVRHQCMDKEKVTKYFTVLKNLVTENNLQVKPHTIWNMDETGMQLDANVKSVLAEKGSKSVHSRTSGNREMITLIGAINAAGACLPPHLIVKGKTKKSLNSFQVEHAPEHSTWSVSDSGWTKQGIALLWFTESFLPNIGSDRPQLLIVDGHDSHNFIELIDIAMQNDIHILELPAHTSNWLQPCDRTVFGPLKQAYRKEANHLKDKFGVLVSRTSFCGLLKSAWETAVTSKNIKSGFRACGIHPFNPSAVPAEAYLPNSLYTTETVMETDSLLADVTVQPSPLLVDEAMPSDTPAQLPVTLSLAVNQPEPIPSAGQLINDIQPTEQEEKRVDAGIMDTSGITDISEYLSNEPNVLGALCAAAPANLALQLLESTFTEKQLHCFQYCYEKGYDLEKESAFLPWCKLKDSSEKQVTTGASYEFDISLESSFQNLPDIGDTSGLNLDLSFDGLISTIGAEMPIADAEITIDDSVARQDQTAVVQELVLSKEGHQNLITRDSTETSVKNKVANSWNTNKFPFCNRSFPNDVDSDVLPYPAQIIKKKKAATRPTHKYFLLTSTEAHQAKLKEAEEKLARAHDKAEKARIRKQKLEEKAKLAEAKEKSKGMISDRSKGKGKNPGKSTRQQQKVAKEDRIPKKQQKVAKEDRTPCGACGVVFCNDRSGQNWIQCSGCEAWYHNACQGLDEKSDSAFVCVTCENESD